MRARRRASKVSLRRIQKMRGERPSSPTAPCMIRESAARRGAGAAIFGDDVGVEFSSVAELRLVRRAVVHAVAHRVHARRRRAAAARSRQPAARVELAAIVCALQRRRLRPPAGALVHDVRAQAPNVGVGAARAVAFARVAVVDARHAGAEDDADAAGREQIQRSQFAPIARGDGPRGRARRSRSRASASRAGGARRARPPASDAHRPAADDDRRLRGGGDRRRRVPCARARRASRRPPPA